MKAIHIALYSSGIALIGVIISFSIIDHPSPDRLPPFAFVPFILYILFMGAWAFFMFKGQKKRLTKLANQSNEEWDKQIKRIPRRMISVLIIINLTLPPLIITLAENTLPNGRDSYELLQNEVFRLKNENHQLRVKIEDDQKWVLKWASEVDSLKQIIRENHTR